MEIGDQQIDGLETIAGGDEQLRFAGKRAEAAVLAGGRLEQAQRRAANGDDATTGAPDAVERAGTVVADFAPLGMHAMLRRILGLHRQEGAGPYVQGDEMSGNAARRQGGKELRRKMQPGGRCGHRPGLARIDGLVALGICRNRRPTAGDVGGQRRIAQRLDRFVEIGPMQAEGKLHLAGLADRDDGGIELAQQADATIVAKADAIATLQALGGPRKGQPAAFVQALVQIEGDRRPLLPPPTLSAQGGANDAGVVEDQRIAGVQEFGQRAHEAIGKWRQPAPAGQDAQATAAPHRAG